MAHYVSIVCDVEISPGERCWVEDTPPGEARSATVARQRLAEQGWHRTRDGRDICPDCWAAGRR